MPSTKNVLARTFLIAALSLGSWPQDSPASKAATIGPTSPQRPPDEGTPKVRHTGAPPGVAGTIKL